MSADIKILRENIHDCKRHLSQIPESVITQYISVKEFQESATHFFNPSDRDLNELLKVNYPLQVKSLFVERNFRIIREIIPEFIVSIITLGSDWLITLAQTKQYRKSEVVVPAPNKDILSDTSTLLLTIINHVNRLIVDKEENEKLIKETNKLLNLYQPKDFHYDIRGCFQLIFNVITLYADQCDGVRTNTLKGFKIFPKGDDDKVDILKGLVGPFCGPYHLLQIEPANSLQNPKFRKLFHERIAGNELVLTAYNPVQRIKSHYPKPKSIWQKKLTEAIHEYLDNYDWSDYLSDPGSFIEGLKKAAQGDRVSEPALEEKESTDPQKGKSPGIRTKILPVQNILVDSGISKWEEVTISRVSKDAVLIKAGSFSGRYTFSELGLKDHRKGDMPNRIWGLLMDLAENGGHIPYEKLTLDVRKKIEKSISDLRQLLKTLTGLSEDPIYRFSKKQGYLTKFLIRDELTFSGKVNEEYPMY